MASASSATVSLMKPCKTSAVVRPDAKADVAAAFDGAYHHRLIADVASTPATRLAADVRLVHLYDALEGVRRRILHRSPDPVAEIPRCLVGDAERPLHLIGAYA